MIEIEQCFLARYLPKDLHQHPSKEVLDIYLPKDHPHPTLRIRKNGAKYEMTKKEVIHEQNRTIAREDTIPLRPDEFAALEQMDGKRLHKIRYFYPYKNHTLEIGVFQGALAGLVLIDVEFKSKEDLEAFEPPDFFLGPVRGKEPFAGGMLCGKSYADIEPHLEGTGYKRILTD